MDLVFLGASIIGGVSVAIWLVFQLLGADGDVETHSGHDLDTSGTADLSFSLLSFQGIASFLTMFGLVGLALNREATTGPVLAAAGGVAAGLATTWLVTRLFHWFRSLQSSGTLNLATAIGQNGRVYLSINQGSTGKVEVSISGRLFVTDAIAEHDASLTTGTPVVVVGIANGQTLIVKPASQPS